MIIYLRAKSKMRTDENCHLFWEDVKQKTAKLDVDAPKLSRKRRAPTRILEFFGTPEYAMILLPAIVEYILNL